MSDKKTKKTSEEKAEQARKKRLALLVNKTPAQEETNEREEFRKYFLKISKKLSLKKSIEDILWTHLKTIGCDKKDKFDEGVSHFGYKV
jgi:hypothetical protein